MATIRKRNNRFQVQIRRKGCGAVSRTFLQRGDAEAWARQMEVRADRHDLPASTKELSQYTVGDLLTRYRDEITSKKRSAESEAYLVNAFLRSKVASYSLNRISAADFIKYREERLKTVKAGTANRELAIIQHAFDIASLQWGIPMKENPLSKIRKLKVINSRNRRISQAEVDSLVGAAISNKNDAMALLIRLAVETAMRRGELLAVEWKDIDTLARTLHIPRSKNGHSRTIPLTSEAIAILEALRLMSKSSVKVFHLTGNAVRLSWVRLTNKAGLTDAHFHDLRHEGISRFFEKGLSVPEVALISGHKDFRMLARYTHMRAEVIAQKLAQMPTGTITDEATG